jgi:hypothetical protein
MRMSKRMTRRMAIGLGIAGTAAMLPARRLMAAAGGSTAEIASLKGMVVALFGDRGAAAALGHAYLAHRPDEGDAARLLAVVLDTECDGGSKVPRLAAADLHAWLRQRTRADFAAGRTVWVDGWLLAQTEAQLYALAAIA